MIIHHYFYYNSNTPQKVKSKDDVIDIAYESEVMSCLMRYVRYDNLPLLLSLLVSLFSTYFTEGIECE